MSKEESLRWKHEDMSTVVEPVLLPLIHQQQMLARREGATAADSTEGRNGRAIVKRNVENPFTDGTGRSHIYLEMYKVRTLFVA